MADDFIYHFGFDPPADLPGDTVIEFNIHARNIKHPDLHRFFRDRIDHIDWGPRTGRRIVRYRVVKSPPPQAKGD